ncbi:helix-turn-helix domain-containing protein [Burkholderia cenocepacia]|jgi:predicted XRE-type DNA-binding protein|uniref:HigA2-like helix-turn-helix domain-containing protein n=1 Tax=Burkholderia cenocepacia (strain ATCC BAA-245 / DSM 16553 / LMG 16656 / NCTC 13227 / J2315 / CF5610) TaxID=216591 RepID=B4EHP8_BURCJ|nr:XRE family transcriptional regulator [Burkholderia cenocepacia]KIS52172.1 helix-turn-helix domain protein [Burkholderia cepacia]EPZ87884.1 DNA-binding helix-turn-helix protein [Burkholderia cenocepacia K56-2Valvano]ERI29588.1 DNA-binding helix-turn-helix protein [Burkholderia cenocepacia BC7]KKI80686.1 DNA-binding protein [Burkholderia cenocepacia]MBR8386300.1 XRE family transcriptional regulator [Burkholderia cenocepacia]
MNRDASYQHTDCTPTDSGFDDAGELSAKSALVLKLNALIASQGLSDEEAAALADMARPVVTPEQRERLRNVSLDLLMRALVSFGQQVEIVVRPAGSSRLAGITVSV